MHELNIVSDVLKNNREMYEICSNLAIKTQTFSGGIEMGLTSFWCLSYCYL